MYRELVLRTFAVLVVMLFTPLIIRMGPDLGIHTVVLLLTMFVVSVYWVVVVASFLKNE